ncbi:MAG: hypothetical protein ACK5JT_02910 [Hyphomicrobiaceae bacterium]
MQQARTLLAIALSLIAWVCPVMAAGPNASDLGRQAILRWINNYREMPEPHQLPHMVKLMHQQGLLQDIESAGLYIGFAAGVLQANPRMAKDLVAGMFPLAPESQVIIVRAIAYSGLPNWKELLSSVAERMPARIVLIQRYLDDKLPTLDKLPLQTSPAVLDTNWGFYYASGDVRALDRIIDALAWAGDQNDLDRLTAGNMAKWTLANNALNSKELTDHLKAEHSRRKGIVRKELGDVIEAAETYDTGRIRREAHMAIEQLKQKGPQTNRNFSFWSQAGQTALAFGCVVAGTLGQAAIAVPCVIGGAATSAVLKLMATPR